MARGSLIIEVETTSLTTAGSLWSSLYLLLLLGQEPFSSSSRELSHTGWGGFFAVTKQCQEQALLMSKGYFFVLPSCLNFTWQWASSELAVCFIYSSIHSQGLLRLPVPAYLNVPRQSTLKIEEEKNTFKMKHSHHSPCFVGYLIYYLASFLVVVVRSGELCI